MTRHSILSIALLVLITPLIQGCVGVVAAGAATGAAVSQDRRTTGTYIDDELIELKVLAAMRNDTALWDQSHINATSFNGVVLLTGEAPAESLRDRVAEITRTIPKVRGVQNEISVEAPSSMLARSGDT